MPQTQNETSKVENLQATPVPEGKDTAEESAVETPELDAARRIDKANLIIKNHVIGVMGASLVPIPLVDLIALTGIQLKMLQNLAKLYDVPFSKNLGKNLIVSLLGGLLPTSAAITVASIFKSVPGLGTVTGIASVSVLGGAVTYAIGNVFVQHFESGGTLLDFDPEKMRNYFTGKVKEGKAIAAKMKSDKSSKDA